MTPAILRPPPLPWQRDRTAALDAVLAGVLAKLDELDMDMASPADVDAPSAVTVTASGGGLSRTWVLSEPFRLLLERGREAASCGPQAPIVVVSATGGGLQRTWVLRSPFRIVPAARSAASMRAPEGPEELLPEDLVELDNEDALVVVRSSSADVAPDAEATSCFGMTMTEDTLIVEASSPAEIAPDAEATGCTGVTRAPVHGHPPVTAGARARPRVRLRERRPSHPGWLRRASAAVVGAVAATGTGGGAPLASVTDERLGASAPPETTPVPAIEASSALRRAPPPRRGGRDSPEGKALQGGTSERPGGSGGTEPRPTPVTATARTPDCATVDPPRGDPPPEGAGQRLERAPLPGKQAPGDDGWRPGEPGAPVLAGQLALFEESGGKP